MFRSGIKLSDLNKIIKEMEQLDLTKILKYAPPGLKLYNDKIKDTVEFLFIAPSYMSYPIKTVQCPWTLDIPFDFDSQGRGALDTKCRLYPMEGASWDNWQYLLFPKSVGSYIIDNRTARIYKIDHPDFVSPIDIPNTSINMKSLDLKYFSYIKPNIEKNKQPQIKVMTDDKYNEFGFDYFDEVLVKNNSVNLNDCHNIWTPASFGCIVKTPMGIMYMANSLLWEECIPLNKYTVHLIGTNQTFDKNLIKSVTVKNKKKKRKNKK